MYIYVHTSMYVHINWLTNTCRPLYVHVIVIVFIISFKFKFYILSVLKLISYHSNNNIIFNN